MNALQLIPRQSTRRSADARALSAVRSQAAFVRALLDEVERVAPHGSEDAVNAQLVEELARLGCRFLEVASALAARVDKQEVRRGAAQTISQCA